MQQLGVALHPRGPGALPLGGVGVGVGYVGGLRSVFVFDYGARGGWLTQLLAGEDPKS